MNLPPDLKEFIGLLNSRGVEYVIVGAYALAFHGRPRYTGDVDILIRPSEENGQRILAVLHDFGFASLGLTLEGFTAEDRVIQLGLPPQRVDILTSLSGVTFGEAWESRVAADLSGVPVAFIGRDAFLRNKRATGRLQDQADLQALGEE